MKTITLQQRAKWMPADIQTPISLFLGLVGNKQGILLESAEVDGRAGRYSVLAWNFRLRLSCKDGKLEVASRDPKLNPLKELAGMDYLQGVREAMRLLDVQPPEGFEDLPPITRGLYGYFGYGMGGQFEPKLAETLPPEQAEACLVLPGQIALFDHLFHRLCLLDVGEAGRVDMDWKAITRRGDKPEVGPISNMPEEQAFKSNVQRAKKLIGEGEGIQVVLSTRFQASFAGEAFTLYRRLRQINPSPYMFFQRLPKVTLLGSSPELMVRCRNGVLESCPIAGTRPRGSC